MTQTMNQTLSKRMLVLSYIVTLSLSTATALSAQVEALPERYRKWLEEEVVYIISPVERETFLRLESEEERRAFVSAFWQRRDTNPNTLENEYKEEHYRRIEYANEFLGRDSFLPGWKTDRGRFYILLGPPSTREDFTYSNFVYPAELWWYQNPELQKYRLPSFFYLLFFKRAETGPFELYDHVQDGPGALLTGYQPFIAGDFREGIYQAYEKLYEVSPELAHASLSFRTDEGNVASDVSPLGTIALLEEIRSAPLVGVDTSYAERFSEERGLVDVDYLFRYVPSSGVLHVLPGPGAYYLHWALELEPQHVAVVRDADSNRYGSIFDVSIELVPSGQTERILMQQRSESFLALGPSEADVGLTQPYLFKGMMPVLAGSYDVRIILRNKACPGRYDDENCRKSYTLFDAAAEVPAFQFERPELSDLILAHALSRPTDSPVYRSYRFGSLSLDPNPLATYAVGESLIALCEPLNAPQGSTLRFSVIEREGPGGASTAAAPERERVRVETTVPADGVRIEPLTQELSLEGIAGGRYLLTVELLSGAGDVLAARRSPFVVTPRTAVPRPVVRGSLSEIAPEIPGTVETLLAEQYLNLDRREEAGHLLDQAVAKNPKLVPALELYGPFLLSEGRSARLVELLSPVYAEVKDRYPIVRLIGLAYHQQGEVEKAIDALERAVTLRRPTPELLNPLAEDHYLAGNVARAIELLERSLREDADQPAVRARLEQMKQDF